MLSARSVAKVAATSPDYTVVQVMLLAGPTLLCLRLGLDPNAVVAVGYFPLTAVLVFPLLALSHGLARRFLTPLPVLLLFLACAVLLSVIGIWVDYWARAWAPSCDLTDGESETPGTYAYDENMEAQFDQPARFEVNKFYAACLHELQANVSGWPAEAQTGRFREMTVQRCPGYDLLEQNDTAFARLEFRETTFACTGLCFPRAPIWTPYYDGMPACGPIMANYMLRTVSRTGIQSATWSIMLVVAASVWAFFLFHHRSTAPEVVRV